MAASTGGTALELVPDFSLFECFPNSVLLEKLPALCLRFFPLDKRIVLILFVFNGSYHEDS